jgi:hypothetical protein
VPVVVAGAELVGVTGAELDGVTGAEVVGVTGVELVGVTGAELVLVTGADVLAVTAGAEELAARDALLLALAEPFTVVGLAGVAAGVVGHDTEKGISWEVA